LEIVELGKLADVPLHLHDALPVPEPRRFHCDR
jgi:hypothetical protein